MSGRIEAQRIRSEFIEITRSQPRSQWPDWVKEMYDRMVDLTNAIGLSAKAEYKLKEKTNTEIADMIENSIMPDLDMFSLASAVLEEAARRLKE